MNINLEEVDKLIYSIIRKFNYCDKEDLYQVGVVGLINAYKHFDNREGVKFTTYAYTYILGEVTKYIRENNIINVSRDSIKLLKTIEKAKDYMRQKLMREPSTLEIALFLDISEDKVIEIESIPKDILSFDYSDLNDTNLYNKVLSIDKDTKPEIMDLKNEIDLLESDEKELIYERYYNDLTQSEVSKKIGISQVQVSRKETKVLEKLKTRL